ncbi:hypothetical protein [Anaerotruncus sp. 1XD42-93]|uniref:hypothetical protein n=1 Tax=Anaerotruncus sp. 1XD42-93 TaxID=2320853 RepID=UPI000EA353ED|nr:hypothetical protein [Anaerotruncus sp. 1XD42-93]NBK18460.1 hypothetical protein [Anaerotruncus sp. 1XD42-93]RKJ86552.1 hypothetical protein D7Y41_19625 [Anaerotruncus sp. 1XD22-93]
MKVQSSIQYYPPRISVKEQEKKTQNPVSLSADEQQKNLLSQLKEQEEAREKSQAQMMQAAMGKSSGGKVSVSTSSQNSVGELATMLANAQSTMDVQRVISKGMMALAGLKMAQPLAEGKQKNKITAQIRRIEKLLKRSRNKIRHLNKEAELERKQKKAEKAQEEQKAHAQREELKSRRNKRRRDETRYAQKEVSKDAQERQEAMLEGMAGAVGGSSPAVAPVAAPVASAPVAAEVPVGADMAAADVPAVSMDISV